MKAGEYRSLFPALIENWRSLWNQGEFPFYFVQIAPFNYREEGNPTALLREAQLFTMQQTENTGMVVTMDIGDCDCIHPADKKTVGNRLAYWALAETYGMEGISCRGPVYKSMEKTGDGRIILRFDHAPDGLTSYGKPIGPFEIAGENKSFQPAQAVINRDRTVTVWSEGVRDPVAVRYAFDDCVEGTLFNIAGLPASPFRTDDWTE